MELSITFNTIVFGVTIEFKVVDIELNVRQVILLKLKEVNHFENFFTNNKLVILRRRV